MATIGIYAPAPWCKTGYGIHAGEIGRRLIAEGHKVVVLSNQHTTAPTMQDGMVITPYLKDPYLDDCLEYLCRAYEIEVIVTLFNFWACSPVEKVKRKLGIPYIVWTPVEGRLNASSLLPEHKAILEGADAIIGVSPWSSEQLAATGAKVDATIHSGIADTYKMLPFEETREKHGIPKDWFVAGFVGRNYTERKLIPYVLKIFADFLKMLREDEREKCKLYLHTEFVYMQKTYDLDRMIPFFGLEKNIIMPPRILALDPVDDDWMCETYNMMNVMLFPSMGEGQNVPLMEAMRCGVPCIAHDAHAHRELADDTLMMRVPTKMPWYPMISRMVEEMYLPDLAAFTEMLYDFYVNSTEKDIPRAWPAIAGTENAKSLEWTWDNSYAAFRPILERVLKHE